MPKIEVERYVLIDAMIALMKDDRKDISIGLYDGMYFFDNDKDMKKLKDAISLVIRWYEA